MTGLVLIAEGDPFNLRLLEELCEEGGFEVVTAGDGETALMVIARQRPALIVLDAGLRTDDGAEVLEVLQTDAALASIPVLLTTDDGDEEARKRGIDLGAADFVARPFRVFEVEQRIKNLLRLATAERAAQRARGSLSVDPEADTDPLTHTGGAAQLRITLDYEATRAVRYEQALTCVVLRITNFDAVVERSGESTGQGLLMQLAANLRGVVRSIDHLFRSDVDEFVVLLPSTSAKDAKTLLQRLRSEGAGLAGIGIDPPAELSLGHASVSAAIDDGERLLHEARAKLAPLG